MKISYQLHSSTAKMDIYEQVTRYVTDALEKGEIIWKKPWNIYGLPKNVVSNKHYRGYNVFLLNFICLLNDFHVPYFLTFKQAQALGGHIKRGERGATVIYWAAIEDRRRIISVIDSLTGLTRDTHPVIRVPHLHTVFNIAQTEGIAFPQIEKIERTITEKIQSCEQVFAGMSDPPLIIHKGEKACYIPKRDEIQLPAPSFFHSDEKYYCTAFHELAHSTGHRKRLNREEISSPSGFGEEPYSREELTAELTSAYLCAVTGIGQTTIENSSAYIKGWLTQLNNDKRFFLKAATQAQAAADYILNEQGGINSDPAEALPQAAQEQTIAIG